MKFTTAITSAIAATSASAMAIQARQVPNNTFLLMTKSDDTCFDGLYIEAYHTGAGLADAVLAGKEGGASFFFNGTRVDSTVYGYNGGSNLGIAGLQLGNAIYEYNSWAATTVDNGQGTTGYTYNETYGLAGDPYYEFAGWMACYWAHNGAPQLFNLAYPPGSFNKPDTCGYVNLFKA
ncbi:hypothetical protein K490DRAFT_66795 [Saccharata proteae CBS 121410]|uniref:DUF7907 domain-containing protein n=1 Tax=Saccharata proteae CBS 121410 TaxID=1314787 RepID=A0A9P4HTH8_9PEZI|nr:hypothetical protein K490DRAFT_66795 [Saccharata proteae CBS 121410]